MSTRIAPPRSLGRRDEPGEGIIREEDVSVGNQTSSFESCIDILAALLGLDGGGRH